MNALIAGSNLEKQVCFAKLILRKTYDHVNYDFLLYMLRRCVFGRNGVT
jgi:hypothetical protein